MDRETLSHFYSEHNKDKFYGVMVDVNNEFSAAKIQKELQTRLSYLKIGRSNKIVFFSGSIAEDLIKAISEYLSKESNILERKLIEGKYEHFVGDPKHWLKKYAGKEI